MSASFIFGRKTSVCHLPAFVILCWDVVIFLSKPNNLLIHIIELIFRFILIEKLLDFVPCVWDDYDYRCNFENLYALGCYFLWSLLKFMTEFFFDPLSVL